MRIPLNPFRVSAFDTKQAFDQVVNMRMSFILFHTHDDLNIGRNNMGPSMM